jgi:uncharacterized membrane protein YfcA
VNGWEAAAVIAAGMAAGGINAVVGSGSLITFPTLLAVGYAPVTANVSNNIGLVPGAISGTLGYRRELDGQGTRIRTLALGSGSGALIGAALLLTLPSAVFDAVVPILVLGAALLMAVQPKLSGWVAGRRKHDARDVGPAPIAIAFFAGIYGGYFGAAQGIIVLTMLSIFVPDDMKRSNALKTLLTGLVNAVAAVFFIVFADVAWEAVALVATGAIAGGYLGSHVGRRINPLVLRWIVVVLGIAVAIKLLLD